MSLYLDFGRRQPVATYACFKANGVSGVARYLDGHRVLHKGLTREEAEDISAAGLRIHTVFETSGGADIDGFPQNGDYFTREQGGRDWIEAVVDARAAGQPEGFPIFLAVDLHMPSWTWVGSDNPRLRAYFAGATQQDRVIGGSGYFIGCYGPDYVCAFIRDTFGITHLWPWLPRPPARPDFAYDLWQYENGASICGVGVDRNDCQLDGWRIEEASMDQYVTKAELEAFIADNRATLEAMKAVETKAIEALRAIRDALKDI